MKWSKYNISFLSEKHKRFVLFSLLSETLWTYPPEMAELFDRIKSDSSFVSELPDVFVKELKEKKFFVDDDRDELSSHVTQVLKERYNPFMLNLTIAVTSACNLGCFYCYEKGIDSASMQRKTEKAIVAFVKKFLDIRHLFVTWYGGEPLMNWSSIKRLSGEFKSLGIDYHASMITNGFLLSPQIISSLRENHITDLQITFDGPKEIHDSRRTQKNGTGTYDEIVKNLEKLFELYPEVHVDLRSNIDRSNVRHYHLLHSFIKKRFPDQDIILYPGFTCSYFCDGCLGENAEMSHPKHKAAFNLHMFKKHGISFGNFIPRRHFSTCIANSLNGFLIDPVGDVYKCWSLMGRKDAVIGNVAFPDDFSMPKIGRFMAAGDYLRDPKCLKCRFITICNGGCPVARINNAYLGQHQACCCIAKYRIKQFLEAALNERTD